MTTKNVIEEVGSLSTSSLRFLGRESECSWRLRFCCPTPDSVESAKLVVVCFDFAKQLSSVGVSSRVFAGTLGPYLDVQGSPAASKKLIPGFLAASEKICCGTRLILGPREGSVAYHLYDEVVLRNEITTTILTRNLLYALRPGAWVVSITKSEKIKPEFSELIGSWDKRGDLYELAFENELEGKPCNVVWTEAQAATLYWQTLGQVRRRFE